MIIQKEVPSEILYENSQKEALLLKQYQFKNSIWNKIISTHDFENLNPDEYFRLVEIYKEDIRQKKDLFDMTPSSIEQKLALIEAIQTKYSNITKLAPMMDEIENLNTYKIRKLQKLMTKFDLTKEITRENLEEFSSDFYLILKGPPLSLLDYFSKSKTQRMNERIFRILEEDMLVHGLKQTLEHIPMASSKSQLDKAKILIKKISKYKIWRYMVLPYDLPWLDKIKISDDLLEKILLDGLDNHQSELLLELKNQNAIDNYERFRKVFRPLALGTGFYFFYQKYNTNIENEYDRENENKNKLLSDFKKLSDAINSSDTTEKTDDELKEAQFQRVLNSFKEHYHTEPTPSEYKNLRTKIYGR